MIALLFVSHLYPMKTDLVLVSSSKQDEPYTDTSIAYHNEQINQHIHTKLDRNLENRLKYSVKTNQTDME